MRVHALRAYTHTPQVHNVHNVHNVHTVHPRAVPVRAVPFAVTICPTLRRRLKIRRQNCPMIHRSSIRTKTNPSSERPPIFQPPEYPLDESLSSLSSSRNAFFQDSRAPNRKPRNAMPSASGTKVTEATPVANTNAIISGMPPKKPPNKSGNPVFVRRPTPTIVNPIATNSPMNGTMIHTGKSSAPSR